MAALTITESALERIANALRSVNGSTPKDACFRLALDEEGNLALAIDTPLPDDNTFQHQGETVLVMSIELAQHFAGRILEVNEAGDFVLA